MVDQHIVQLFYDRSEEAIGVLSETYEPYCLSIAQRILSDRADAEECVNDAYLRVWETVPPEKPCSLKTYLGTIVRHLALNRYKHIHTQKRKGDRTARALEELAECMPLSSGADTMTEDLAIRDCLNGFLKTLSKRERIAFVRRYWYMASASEIANELHVEENTVYVMLSRLRQKLKAMLEKEGVVL